MSVYDVYDTKMNLSNEVSILKIRYANCLSFHLAKLVFQFISTSKCIPLCICTYIATDLF
jgi:uncharacterized membrane protein